MASDHHLTEFKLQAQTAIVAGPEGREIYTDSYGRVKLRFHWDRYGSKDENASPWIRVNYPAAGTGFGGISIPRIGQEVIVDFEHGRPDMPIEVENCESHSVGVDRSKSIGNDETVSVGDQVFISQQSCDTRVTTFQIR